MNHSAIINKINKEYAELLLGLTKNVEVVESQNKFNAFSRLMYV